MPAPHPTWGRGVTVLAGHSPAPLWPHSHVLLGFLHSAGWVHATHFGVGSRQARRADSSPQSAMGAGHSPLVAVLPWTSSEFFPDAEWSWVTLGGRAWGTLGRRPTVWKEQRGALGALPFEASPSSCTDISRRQQPAGRPGGVPGGGSPGDQAPSVARSLMLPSPGSQNALVACPGVPWLGGAAGLMAFRSALRFEDLSLPSLLRRDGVFPASTAHGGVSEGPEALPGRVSAFSRVSAARGTN